MPKNKKEEWFKWKIDEWSMGKISVQEYFTNDDGSETLRLEISVPSKMGTPDRVKNLLLKNYKSVILTPDKGNVDFLQLSFTNIDLDEKEEEMTD